MSTETREDHRQHVPATRAPLADRGDLFGQVLDPRAGCSVLGDIALVEALQIVVKLGVSHFDELCQGRAGEVAVLVVDRLDPGAIHGQQLSAEQLQLAAKQHELAEDRAESLAVVAPEIGNGLEVGLQMPQQPDHLNVAMGLSLQPAARSNPVEVAVDVKLQQILWCITRTPGHLGRHTEETRRRQIQSFNEGVDEPHRVLRTDIVVHAFWQEKYLGSVVTGNVRHAGFYQLSCRAGILLDRVFTRSA